MPVEAEAAGYCWKIDGRSNEAHSAPRHIGLSSAFISCCRSHCVHFVTDRSSPSIINLVKVSLNPSQAISQPQFKTVLSVNILWSFLWPPYVIGQAMYIFMLRFLLSSFFLPRLISAVGDWISTILPHMMWPYSVNLECRSETCCARLAENTARKNRQKVAIWAPSHNFVGLYLRN